MSTLELRHSASWEGRERRTGNLIRTAPLAWLTALLADVVHASLALM